MKEITLRELMNMADPEAHDGIGDLWNDKTIHQLVIFTSADEDFEIIGVGPALPYTTLEDAARHVVPGKTAEFFLKCPAANPNRLQPKPPSAPKPAAPRPPTPSPIPPPSAVPALKTEAVVGVAPAVPNPPEPAPPAISPTFKAKTSAPFLRPAIKLGPRAGSVPPAATTDATQAGVEGVKIAAPTVKPATLTVEISSSDSALAAREQVIVQREKELSALADTLKIREASLRDREAALAAMEERLLNVARKSG